MCIIHDCMVAIQPLKKLIMKQQVENIQCRICDSELETLGHLISACNVMTLVHFKHWYNAVYKVFLAYNRGLIRGTCSVYRYKPQEVRDSSVYGMY